MAPEVAREPPAPPEGEEIPPAPSEPAAPAVDAAVPLLPAAPADPAPSEATAEAAATAEKAEEAEKLIAQEHEKAQSTGLNGAPLPAGWNDLSIDRGTDSAIPSSSRGDSCAAWSYAWGCR